MSDIKYWLWLHTRVALTPHKIRLLLKFFKSPEGIYLATRTEYDTLGELTPQSIESLCDKSLIKVERIIEYCLNNKISIISREDEIYPKRLYEIYHAPLVLFIKGELPDIDDEIAVSFVGTRKCSAYGEIAAEKIASEFAASGGLVISGMALGVDSAAQKAALRAGAKTVAVLGSGVDVCYPRKNKKLMEEICENGAVISEFVPGTPPDKYNFPIRNRIISGLSLGVVVVEAPERSGALITATYAEEQGRDVFAVPGDITNPLSAGTNRLIADGAKLVASADDILCEYRQSFAHRIKNVAEKENNIEKKESADLEELLSGCADENQRAILSAIGTDTHHIDEIVAKSNLSAKDVLAMLTFFEISGIVEQTSGKYFKIIL